MIGFIGDEHGSTQCLITQIHRLVKAGATTLIQVGDYACYNAYQRHAVEKAVAKLDLTMYVIDGNHEIFVTKTPPPFPGLEKRYALDPDGPVTEISEHVIYVPRGELLEIEGLKILFLGGGSSIDRAYRLEGDDWFEEENITFAQSQRALDQGEADILVSHEPTTRGFMRILSDRGGIPFNDIPGDLNRQILSNVFEISGAQLNVHGHMHHALIAGDQTIDQISLGIHADDDAIALVDPEGEVKVFQGIRWKSVGYWR